MIIAFIFAFLTGAFTVLLVQAFLLYKWWSTKERDTPKLVLERGKVTNPKIVSDYLKSEGATDKETCMFLNLLMSFLWQEWRDSPKTRQFFMKKMNMEFSDLMNSKTAGRLIEQITILDLNLGKSLPVFKGATIMKVGATKDATEVPKELDIALDLEYTGGCHMTIQVDFLFNKTAYFSVKLVCLRGRARLRFSRDPCTHWSLSFYEEPEMEFDAESHLEGKNIEQLTSLIVNHLRKTMNKKHTLPNYKIRYLPFFPKLEPQSEKEDIYIHDSMITMGQLDVIVNGCSRLPEIDGAAILYCSLSVDVLPWKQLAENSRALWTTFEVEITRDNTTASFGMTLSKDYGETDINKVVFVETVVPSSPAEVAGLHRGDVIVSVEGQRIDSLKQAAKLIKNKTKFTANFQRPPSKNKSDQQDGADGVGVNFRNVAVDSEESDSEEAFVNIMLPIIEEKDGNEATKSAMRDLLTKSTELRQRSRKRSKDNFSGFKDAHDGSSNVEGMRGKRAMTVATDGKHEVKPPEANPRALSPMSRSATMKPSKTSSPTDEGIKNSLVIKPSTYSDIPGTKRTKEVPFSQEPNMGDTVKFDVSSKDRYLNVCVWSKFHEKNYKDLLIGHVTIPLMDIVVQCLALGSKRHEQSYVLVSPHIDRIISRLNNLRGIPGLNSSLVGGDISLAFVHYPSLEQCDDSAVLEKIEELEKIKAEEEEWEQENSLESENMEHNFILTQFYFPTRCNYCSKKIWRKVAFQCRNCALICHKKCLDSCRRFSSCLRSSGRKSRWFSKSKSSDIKAQEKTNADVTPKEQEQQETKETGHSTTHRANEKTPPILEEERESEKMENEKSKERSGDLTPNQETSKPITQKPVDDKAAKEELAHEMDEASGPVVQEKGEAVAADMVAASEQVKEMGRELFSNLSPDARKKKLQDMMARLQVEIDEENETLGELYQSKKRTKDKKQKAHIVSLITKSEDRGQALAMLMLQYCAGLQDCADAEDEDCYEL